MGDIKFMNAQQFMDKVENNSLTPRDIWEWKIQWQPYSFDVPIIDTRLEDGIAWCKDHCEAWQWDIEKYTHQNKHTFMFENKIDANDFEEYING